MERLLSRKFLLAVLSVILFTVFEQYEAAATIATGYVLGQGIVDGMQAWSFNKGQAEVQVKAMDLAGGPVDPE